MINTFLIYFFPALMTTTDSTLGVEKGKEAQLSTKLSVSKLF